MAEASDRRRLEINGALIRREVQRRRFRCEFDRAVRRRRSAVAIGHVSTPRRAHGHAARPRAQAMRSSAKSGDSPSDDPGEPEPPWPAGHGDVEEHATNYRPPLLVRLVDRLNRKLRRF